MILYSQLSTILGVVMHNRKLSYAHIHNSYAQGHFDTPTVYKRIHLQSSHTGREQGQSTRTTGLSHRYNYRVHLPVQLAGLSHQYNWDFWVPPHSLIQKQPQTIAATGFNHIADVSKISTFPDKATLYSPQNLLFNSHNSE